MDGLSEKTKSTKKSNLSEVNMASIIEENVDVEVVSTEEDFDRLAQQWEDFIRKPEVDAHVFQTFEWQRLWWKHFGGNNKLHIITVWKNNNTLIGIAPFFIDEISILGLYDYKKLKFIGSSIPNNDAVGGFTSYSISDYLDIIVDPDHRDLVVKTFIEQLGESRRFVDQIELNELSETGTFINQVLPKIWHREWQFDGKPKEICPKIQLPETTDQYLDNLDSKRRYKLRYSKRAVTEKDLFKVYQVQNDNEFDSAFENFVELHQKRWNKQGYPGIFANKEFQNFMIDVGRAFIKEDRLKMSTAIDHDGQCIAVDFAFRFKDQIYDYQKAFDAESDLAKYSPGKALMYFMIEDAIGNKDECVDLLRGGEKYKMRFANHKTQNWIITIPGYSNKESLLTIMQTIRKLKENMQREQLLLKVHLKQWGIGGFLPHYSGFLKKRIQEKF